MGETITAQKKKIAFVSNSAWSVYNFRMDVIRHLLPRYAILVIAPADEFSELLTEAGCIFMPVSFNKAIVLKNPLREYMLYQHLKSIYRIQQPDFIFHYVIKPNIYGSLAAAANSIPSVAVVTGLGYSFARFNWLYRTVIYLYRKALHKASEVWFLNPEDAALFLKKKIVQQEKVKILPGEGINTRYFAPVGQRPVAREKTFQFLMSTRLLKSKGVRIYAEAARLLIRKKLNLRFVLIGFFEKHHPDSITELELRVWQKRGLIQYGGFARDVRPFLRQADCLVFPSFYSEGVPRCLLEAASMEIPIITSRNRGCTEVVEDGLNGFLTKVNDIADLAAKMEIMMNLPASERAEMGRKGRQKMLDKFDVNAVIAAYDRTLFNTKI